MKIGFFTDGYPPQINGVATSTEGLAKSLRKKGHKVIVVAPNYPRFKDKDQDVLRLKSIKIYKNPEMRISYMFPDKILREVMNEKFDIFHGFAGGTTPSLGLVLSKIKKKPYVFTYNTRVNQYTHYILNGKLIKPEVLEKAMEVYCNRCDAIVAPSGFIKEELLSFGVKKPIFVIPNGVDVNKFGKVKTGVLKKQLNLKSKDKIILYLGRVAKEKSIDFIIRVFKKVSKETKEAYLLIAGDGPEKENLEKLTQKLGLTGRVIFLGYVNFEDVPGIYSESDIFVFASETETQGMVILEAMASNLPVITVKDKAFENIIDDKTNGIFLPKNEELFAKTILLLLKNSKLRTKLSVNARKRAEEFSVDEVAKKFDTLYKSLL